MGNIIRKFIRANRGAAAIEMAIILPILILLLIGAMEFGLHLLAGQTAQRSLDNITDSIQKNPTDPNLQTIALNSGLSFAKFNEDPNFFCAKAYATLDEAQAGMCGAGEWDTTRPGSVGATAAYYVGIRAYVEPLALGIVSDYLPPVDYESVFQVNPGGLTPPTCIGDKVLQFDGTNYICADISTVYAPIPPNCNGSDKALQYFGGQFQCVTVTAGTTPAPTPAPAPGCTNFCIEYFCENDSPGVDRGNCKSTGAFSTRCCASGRYPRLIDAGDCGETRRFCS